ncbi:PAS domain S-box protein [Parasalinivibrio latis]|uniref:PAS domain S-box protein n=1 Tax=Parasalinivibrio latis TaxID=2952610 RepID=UPI0030DF0F78
MALTGQKELISAVGRFDAINSEFDHEGGALGGTLSQLVSAHQNYNLLNASSVFVLAEKDGERFIPIMLHDENGVEVSDAYQLGGGLNQLPGWLSAVSSTLKGSERGVVDAHGMMLVYDSLIINDHNFLILLKDDLNVIRTPFLKASLAALIISILLIYLSVRKVTNQINPIIRELDEQVTFNNNLFNTIKTPIIVTNNEAIIENHNIAASETFNYDEQSLNGLKIDEIIPKYQELDLHEHIGVCNGGEEIYLQLAYGNTEINDKLLHVYIATDITQRKQAGVMMRDLMAKSAAILDTVKDGIFTIDDKGIIHSVNPAVEKIFGYFCGEFEGQNIKMITPDGIREKHDGFLEKYKETGEHHVIGATREMQAQHKDGHVFPLELTVNEFYIGSERYFTGVVRDITERKLAEAELQKHRDNLQEMVAVATSEIEAIVKTAVNGVVTIDETGTIKIFNPAAERMFGWSADDIIGQNVAKLVPDIDRVTHDGFIKNYIITREAKIIGRGREVEALKKDGKRFPAHLAVGHSQLSENKHLFVAFIADITEQKNAEKELIVAKNNAEEAARVKANFLANMSHEIRTPMNAIIGFSEILLQDKDLSDSGREHAVTIHSSGKNLLNIINDILDFSKIEAGSITLEHVCFNLRNVLQDTLRTLSLKAADKDLELVCKVSPEIAARVDGDPTRLRQVIINLIGNSIKFTPSGSVTLQVEPVPDSDLIQFSVIDTGIGMTAEQVDRVFDAFSQADASTNRKFGGTGLGTTISKQIVGLMGGDIWAESELNKGTTFHFTALLLPSENIENCLFEDGSYVESGYLSPRSFNILLAEDIPTNATLATLRLEEQGHTVVWADNGRKAVDHAVTEKFDIVLMDVQMPELDGMEASKEIRKRMADSEYHLPIVALTASVMKEDEQECFDAGMDALVGKPIDFDVLLSTMEDLVPAGRGKENTGKPALPLSVQEEIDFSYLSGIVDVDKGLKTWGDSLVYATSLVKFAEERVASGAELEDLLQNHPDDPEPPRSIAHALKGLAGNLSITDVAELATIVDDLLKIPDVEHALAKTKEMNKALDIAAKAILKLELPKNETHEEVEPIDPEQIKEILNKIIEGLNELNPDAVEPHIKTLERFIDKKELSSIKRHIDAFDFDSASEEALALVERIDSL